MPEARMTRRVVRGRDRGLRRLPAVRRSHPGGKGWRDEGVCSKGPECRNPRGGCICSNRGGGSRYAPGWTRTSGGRPGRPAPLSHGVIERLENPRLYSTFSHQRYPAARGKCERICERIPGRASGNGRGWSTDTRACSGEGWIGRQPFCDLRRPGRNVLRGSQGTGHSATGSSRAGPAVARCARSGNGAGRRAGRSRARTASRPAPPRPP
jgi:hypothetical protein